MLEQTLGLGEVAAGHPAGASLPTWAILYLFFSAGFTESNAQAGAPNLL